MISQAGFRRRDSEFPAGRQKPLLLIHKSIFMECNHTYCCRRSSCIASEGVLPQDALPFRARARASSPTSLPFKRPTVIRSERRVFYCTPQSMQVLTYTYPQVYIATILIPHQQPTHVRHPIYVRYTVSTMHSMHVFVLLNVLCTI